MQKLNWKKIAEWNIFEKYRQTNGCLWKWFWKGLFLALPYYGHYAWISPQAKNWLLVLRLLALGFKGLCEIGPLFIVAQIYDKSRCYALFIVVKSHSNRYPHCIHTTELSMATVACCERHNGSLSTCFADLTLKKELNCLVKVACTINNIELYYTVNKPHINTCSY